MVISRQQIGHVAPHEVCTSHLLQLVARVSRAFYEIFFSLSSVFKGDRDLLLTLGPCFGLRFVEL